MYSMERYCTTKKFLYNAGCRLVACTDFSGGPSSQRLLFLMVGADDCFEKVSIICANFAATGVGFNEQFVDDYVSYIGDWIAAHPPWLEK